MKKIHNILIYLSLPLALAGCLQSNEDLQDWMNTESAKLKGNVEPLPSVIPFVPLNFVDDGHVEPFAPKRALTAGTNAPDQNRKKEFLESFSLESLSMVGIIIKNNTTFALVKSPDGNVNVLKQGNYIGRNYGQIQTITNDHIAIKEVFQNSNGEWNERQGTLNLQESGK